MAAMSGSSFGSGVMITIATGEGAKTISVALGDNVVVVPSSDADVVVPADYLASYVPADIVDPVPEEYRIIAADT